MQAKFEQSCADGEQYQIQVPDLQIMTSVDPCLYSGHGGLNETFVLSSINGKTISSMHYEIFDLEFIASREKSAKKRRLTLTPDYSAWKTTVMVRNNNKGAVKPYFYEGVRLFSSTGGEKQDRRARSGKGGEQ